MNALIVIIVALCAAGVGAGVGVAVGGSIYRRKLAYVFQNIGPAARRAQHASAMLENADLPGVLERVERMDEKADETHAEVVRHHQRATEALSVANEAVARAAALEQAVAGSLGITTLTKR